MASSQRYQRLDSVEKENDNHSAFEDVSHGLQSRRSYLQTVIIVILGITNLVFAALWLHTWNQRDYSPVSDCVRPQLIYSPATSAIRYEKKRLWRDIDGPNPFTGSPRPSLDQAWRDIIALSADELSRFNEGDSTIAFKDGSGYIAEMGMYHELHCVKRVRRYLHLDHYYPNMTDADRRLIKLPKFKDHCLEYWRQSVMCRGDTTLGTFFWRDGVPTSRVYTDNECVDWHKLDHWARQRKVNMADYSQFAHEE
ncbi:uncharacterized protein PG998_004270 [Apiospora kogelbergensis]|uniref:uncharacterized protein n=1 Tax=Apiospora kogelbergensis TaxID=1337665 RepID=UPI0031326DA1